MSDEALSSRLGAIFDDITWPLLGRVRASADITMALDGPGGGEADSALRAVVEVGVAMAKRATPEGIHSPYASADVEGLGGWAAGASAWEGRAGERKREIEDALASQDLKLLRRAGDLDHVEVYEALATVGRELQPVALTVVGARAGWSVRQRVGRVNEVLSRVTGDGAVRLFSTWNLPDGSTCALTELVRGRSLAERLERTAPTRDEALEVLLQVAEFTHELHAGGWVHGHLEPRRVIVDGAAARKRSVRVIGLDESCRVGDRPDFEDETFRWGSIFYLAPEALEGRRLGVTADVYALGVLCHEMFLGGPPDAWLGSSAKILWEKCRGLPIKVDDHPRGAGLSVAAREAIARALLADPEKRQGSVEEFIHAFVG